MTQMVFRHPVPSIGGSFPGAVKWLIGWLAGGVLLLSSTVAAHAAPDPASEAASAQTPATIELNSNRVPDVRVLIDISGSMKENDPHNLRRPALELLVQLLPKGARAGVWSFGEWVNMLVNHQDIDSAWRASARDGAKQITSVGLRTNIGLALQKAAYDFAYKDKQGDFKTSVILLTDGMVDVGDDPARNQRARQKILDDILPLYQRAGVTIHTIALSRQADTQLLEQLAIETNGIAAIAESAEELMKIFLRAFDDAVPSEQVPLEDNRFLIDKSVDEFTLLVFRKAGADPAVLLSPLGERYSEAETPDNINWFATGDYDLVTVQQPEQGEWRVEAEVDPDNRVTVVSDLGLHVARIPRNVFLGNLPDFSVNLYEQDKVIQLPTFLQLMKIMVEVREQQGEGHWRKELTGGSPPADGLYTATLSMLREPGPYEVSVVVDGKTFERRNKQLIRVHRAFALELEPSRLDAEQLTISLYAKNSDLDMDSVAAMASIAMPSGKLLIRALQKEGARRWEVQVPLEEAGEYRVSAEISGSYRSGKDFELSTETLSYGHWPNGMPPAEEPPAQPLSEPEPQITPPPPPPEPVLETPAPLDKEPVVEPVPAVAPVPEPVEEEGVSSIVLYSSIALVNLLIIGVIFIAYRVLKAGRGSGVLENDVDDNDNLDIPVERSIEDDVFAEDDDIDFGGEPSAASDADHDEELDFAPLDAEEETVLASRDDDTMMISADDDMPVDDDEVDLVAGDFDEDDDLDVDMDDDIIDISPDDDLKQ